MKIRINDRPDIQEIEVIINCVADDPLVNKIISALNTVLQMSFSVLAKRNGAEPNVLNGACANVACPNVFCPDGFCGDGFCIENAICPVDSSCDSPDTLCDVPPVDPNFDTCHPLRTDCGDVVGVICHTSTDTLCPIIG